MAAPKTQNKTTPSLAVNWHAQPFARLVGALMVGILLSQYIGYSRYAIGVAMATMVASGIFLYATTVGFRHRWLTGLAISGVLIGMGWLRGAVNDDRNATDFFAKIAPRDTAFIVGYVNAPPIVGGKRTKLRLTVQRAGNAIDSLRAASGHLLCYIDSSRACAALQYGDVVLLRSRPQTVSAPLNPNELDLRQVLHFQNIHYRAFIKTAAWQKIDSCAGNPIMRYAYITQRLCVARIAAAVPSREEQAVAAALIIGYTEDISDEVRKAYINTGSMHVLSVSGLHVGLVYIALNALLRRIKTRRKWWRWVQVLLELSFIWGFSLATGASAAVLRSAAMLSLVIVGNAFSRTNYSYNTLAAAAFLLLIFDPYLLWNIGFELSFLAVLGLIYAYKPIYQLFSVDFGLKKPKKGQSTFRYRLLYALEWLLDWVWNVTAVGIAAQIITLPLSLYYFHQFPVYFWLSGLVVIPLATLALWEGIALMLLGGVPYIGAAIGSAMYATIWAMNHSLLCIEQLPMAVLNGFWVSGWQMWVGYAALVGSFVMLELRQLRLAYLPLGLCIVLAVGTAWRKYAQVQQPQITVYQAYRKTIIGVSDAAENVYVTDTATETRAFDFATEGLRLQRGTTTAPTRISVEDTLQTPNFCAKPPFYQFGKHRFVVLNPATAHKGIATQKLKVTMVLLSQNPKIDIADITQQFDTQYIVIDGSNASWSIARWQTQAAESNIVLWLTKEQGAFSLPQ